MITPRLRSRVRTMGIILCCLLEELSPVSMMMLRRSLRCERRLYPLRVSQLQRPIYLVGTYVVEPLTLIPLRSRLPVQPRSLQQRQRTHHVGLCKRERILYRAVHVRLSSQMYDTVYALLPHQPAYSLEVTYILFHERVVRHPLYIAEISQITRVRQLIQVDDMILRILVYEQANHMVADKPGTTRY